MKTPSHRRQSRVPSERAVVAGNRRRASAVGSSKTQGQTRVVRTLVSSTSYGAFKVAGNGTRSSGQRVNQELVLWGCLVGVPHLVIVA